VVERRTVAPEVAGSIPVTHPRFEVLIPRRVGLSFGLICGELLIARQRSNVKRM
jgi:hypothetical protein